MSQKSHCTVENHRSIGDCLLALDRTREPDASSPQDLVYAVPCLFTRIKHRIIRLRRRTDDDWTAFRNEVESNLDTILNHFDTRWLISVCDTYADHGDPVERRNAMLISLMVTWEKLSLSHRLAQGDLRNPDADPAALHAMLEPQPLWDGMTCMVTSELANVLPNMFTRLTGLVSETPVIGRILRTVFDRMRAHDHSTLTFLNRHHPRDLFQDIESAWQQSPVAAPPQAPSSKTDQAELVGNLMELANAGSELARTQQIQQSETSARLERLEQTLERLSSETNTFTQRAFVHHAWVEEMRYRDLLELLNRETPIVPPLNVKVTAEQPVADDSPDHKYPNGTARDNTRAPWFVRKCEQLFGRKIAVLDLGCAGGGLIFDFSLRGHLAVGLEGSDYSKKRGRAEWRTLSDRLFTCDITRPFEVVDAGSDAPMRFDLITAWDVVEHLPEDRMPQFFENIRKHLSQGGMFVGTISTRPSGQCPDGSFYHATVRPKQWWIDIFSRHGFSLEERGPFEHRDFPRGNGVSPMYPADFEAAPETGFHFAAKLPESRGALDAPDENADAASLIAKGEAAHAAGDLTTAETLFASALLKDPENLDALNNYGVVLGEQGALAEAVACFRRALEFDPKFEIARQNCASLLRSAGYEMEAAALPPSTGDATEPAVSGDSSQSPDVDPRRAYLHLENICGRARLEIEKVKNYLILNGWKISEDATDSGWILLFGCAFNEHTEQASLARLTDFLGARKSSQNVLVIEGLADTMGKSLVRDRVVAAEHVIRSGQYERLDQFFMRRVPYREVPEANFIGQFDGMDARDHAEYPRASEGRFQTYSVQVGHGCNDNCAFCGDKVVVKNIRSKSPEDCLEEVKRGIALGYKHIELIGDDVGAYGVDIGTTVIELLNQVVALHGEFVVTMRELNTKYITRYLEDFERLFKSGRFTGMELAFQSGNDRVLELMRRGYTRDELLRTVKTLKKHGIGRHAHAIVGFPTETRAEFEDTVSVLIEGEFESASIFVYQDRRTASASRIEPKVSEDEKQARLNWAEQYLKEHGYETERRDDKLKIRFVSQDERVADSHIRKCSSV